MREAGTVQTLLAKSNSSQVAPLTSPVREAVRMVDMRALALMLRFFLSSAMSLGTSL